jgi:hypothetical protein
VFDKRRQDGQTGGFINKFSVTGEVAKPTLAIQDLTKNEAFVEAAQFRLDSFEDL